MTALTRRLTRLEAKNGCRGIEPISVTFRRVIDADGEAGELQAAMLVGGGRCQREAGEAEDEFKTRVLSKKILQAKVFSI
jgi:hypothetical protein